MSGIAPNCLDDDQFRALQAALMKQPTAGDVIKDTGGLRKLRFADARRGKGKSGGLRIIYYWRVSASLILVVHALRQGRSRRPQRETARPA